MSAGAHQTCGLMIMMSDTFKGAGCAKGGTFMSSYANFRLESTTRESLKEAAMTTINAAGSSMDTLSNFTDGSRAVIVLSSSNDASVPDKNQWGIYDTFSELGMDGTDGSSSQNLKHLQTGATGHNFEDYYPEEMISFLYDTLGYGSLEEGGDTRRDEDEALGTYTKFDQREFFPSSIDWSDENAYDRAFYGRQNGWIYTPTACQGAGSSDCRVHFALHGCQGRAENLGKVGYNDLASTNKIIMVYPDVACWDNEGDVDPTGFNTNTGMIPLAIKAMVERLTATSTTGGEGSSTTEEGDSAAGDQADSCVQYDASIEDAFESIASVRDFANGLIEYPIQFDSSSLESIPTSCEDQSNALEQMRTEKLRHRFIVIRTVVDILRAERTPWDDIHSTRESLKDNDDALVDAFDSLFWI